MNPRSSGKRTVASLQDLWNKACEAASSSLWKVPSADGGLATAIAVVVSSAGRRPAPMEEVVSLDSLGLRETDERSFNSSKRGVATPRHDIELIRSRYELAQDHNRTIEQHEEDRHA